MNLRAPRHLALLALVAPVLAVVPAAGPAVATRPDAVSAAYVVDEWTDGDPSTLPDEPYSRVEVTYDATYGITLDGQVRTSLPSWKNQQLVAPAFDRPILDVAGGTTFGLALDDQGHLNTWGSAPDISTEDLAETYRDVAASDGGALGVTSDGEVRYWGTATTQFSFGDVSDVVSVDMDSGAAVALTNDGHVLSSGAPLVGSYFESAPFPEDRADETFTAIDAGVNFAVALTEDGEVVSWGSYQQGEDAVPSFPPGRHAVAVSAGMWMAAAILDDGTVVTWGQPEHTEIPGQRTGLPVVDLDLDRYRSAVTYAALTSTGTPTISGVPQYGTELTATPGTWSDEPDEVHYEWRLHSGGNSSVVGTDSPSYTPTAQDALDWGTLTVTVTAEKDGFVSGTATSAETDHIAQKLFTTDPTVNVSGDPRVGQVLTASTTDAAPAPDDSVLTWYRMPEEGSDDDGAEEIDGASGATLTLTPDLVGAQIFANVTSYKDGYQPTFDESDPITILPGTLTAPTITVTGTPRVGQTLTASATGATPDSDTTGFAWYVRTGPGDLSPLGGATTPKLALTPDLAGKLVVARATVTKNGYTTATADSQVITVAPGTLTAPTVTVSGTPRVGQTLTAATTADALATTSYQWLRGSAPIAGATANNYRPVAADLRSTLRVRVTSTATGYDAASADSAPTAAVSLGATKLRVKAPKKAVVGRKATIKVRGLAAGERFSVKVAGKRLTGKATKSGVGKVKLRVTGKPGSRAVTVVGSLPDRKGTARLRVVPARRH